jgi:hypothetical protein
MFGSLVARGEGPSWQAKRSWCDDDIFASFGKTSPDRSQVAADDLKLTL